MKASALAARRAPAKTTRVSMILFCAAQLCRGHINHFRGEDCAAPPPGTNPCHGLRHGVRAMKLKSWHATFAWPALRGWDAGTVSLGRSVLGPVVWARAVNVTVVAAAARLWPGNCRLGGRCGIVISASGAECSAMRSEAVARRPRLSEAQAAEASDSRCSRGGRGPRLSVPYSAAAAASPRDAREKMI